MHGRTPQLNSGDLHHYYVVKDRVNSSPRGHSRPSNRSTPSNKSQEILIASLCQYIDSWNKCGTDQPHNPSYVYHKQSEEYLLKIAPMAWACHPASIPGHDKAHSVPSTCPLGPAHRRHWPTCFHHVRLLLNKHLLVLSSGSSSLHFSIAVQLIPVALLYRGPRWQEASLYPFWCSVISCAPALISELCLLLWRARGLSHDARGASSPM